MTLPSMLPMRLTFTGAEHSKFTAGFQSHNDTFCVQTSVDRKVRSNRCPDTHNHQHACLCKFGSCSRLLASHGLRISNAYSWVYVLLSRLLDGLEDNVLSCWNIHSCGIIQVTGKRFVLMLWGWSYSPGQIWALAAAVLDGPRHRSEIYLPVAWMLFWLPVWTP